MYIAALSSHLHWKGKGTKKAAFTAIICSDNNAESFAIWNVTLIFPISEYQHDIGNHVHDKSQLEPKEKSLTHTYVAGLSNF